MELESEEEKEEKERGGGVKRCTLRAWTRKMTKGLQSVARKN